MPYNNISERVIYLLTTSLVMLLTILSTELWNLFGAQLGLKNSQADISSEVQKEWGISKCLACYSAYLIGPKAKCSAVITLQTHRLSHYIFAIQKRFKWKLQTIITSVFYVISMCMMSRFAMFCKVKFGFHVNN